MPNLVEELLENAQAVITNDHFVYNSGEHGSVYVNKDAVYRLPRFTRRICQLLAQEFVGDNVETVIAPAVGGVALSQWTAFHLTEMYDRDVFAVFADKDDNGGFIIKRGYPQHIKGKRVLVVEDVITTGASVRKVVDEVRAQGGEVIGLGALCNRGKVTAETVGNPPRFISLVNVELIKWLEGNCPLCKAGMPVNIELGKGREFLARQKAATKQVKK